MFVVSFSSSRFVKVFVPFVAVVVASVVIFSCFSEKEKNSHLQVGSEAVSSSTDVVNYISSLGWVVSEEPDEIKEVVIPHEFNDVYLNYNEIQKAQGFDLTDYAGERVKMWTYTVTNYPGYEDKDCVKINILVYEGCVIGGDVCSVELDGFMYGLSGGSNG